MAPLRVVDERLDLAGHPADREGGIDIEPVPLEQILVDPLPVYRQSHRLTDAPVAQDGVRGVYAGIAIEQFGQVEPHADDPDARGEAARAGPGRLDLLLGLVTGPEHDVTVALNLLPCALPPPGMNKWIPSSRVPSSR